MKISSSVKVLLVCALSLFAAQIAPAQNAPAQKPAPVAPRITAAVDDSKLVTLAGNVRKSSQAQVDQGAAPDSLELKRMMLVLKRSPEQDAALHTLIDQQQDPGSPNFHKWLTPEEFGQKFGPADSDIQTVKAWLEGHGFQVTNLTKGKTVIEFTGTAALVKSAFHTEIHSVMVNGEKHWSNIGNPQIPAALEPVVLSIASLHSFFKKPMHHIVHSNVSARVIPGKKPAILLSNGTTNFFALAPSDWATIYNVTPQYTASITGSGRTIGVIGRTNIDLNDVSDFRNLAGLPANTPTVVLNGPDPGDVGGGEEVEALLDNEWSGGIGQGATVKFVVSESTETSDGVTLSEVYIVDNNLSDIMSESFSLCEPIESQFPDILNLDEVLSEQAAAQGITFIAATGDAGAAGCDNASETTETGGLAVGLPGSVPFTTAVGGTMFNENGNNNTYWDPNTGDSLKYIPEEVWNESCSNATCTGGNTPNLSATGGGVSVVFAKPSYQAGVAGIPADGARDVPDISFSAAGHDGYIVCLQGSCSDPNNISLAVIAGTSASTPSFAGVMSLVDQKTNSRQGLANFVLYKLAAAETFANCNGSTLQPGTPPAANCVFNDVTHGNNSVPGETNFPNGKYAATTGYDPATGLGSANVNNLVNNWNASTGTATTTTLAIAPTSIAHGSNVTASGTVTGSGGTPTGDISFLADGQSLAGLGFDSLAAGAYSTSIPDLPGGGPYAVVAHYSGDKTFKASTSNSVMVTVTAEGSSTSVSILSGSSGNPITTAAAGSPVIVRVDVAGDSGQGIPTGTVTLADADANDGGTLTLNSEGFAELQTTSLAAGSHAFSATYNGDSSFNTSASGTANLTITGGGGGGSFAVSANPTTQTVSKGSPATTTVTATGSGGFSGSVALTASVAGPAGASNPPACAFNPTSIPLSAGTSTGMSTLTCSTVASSQVVYIPLRGPNRPLWIGVSALFTLACIYLLALPAQKKRWTMTFALVVLAAATAVAGCGGGGGGNGGGGNGGTTSGTYTVTITGTSGSAHSTTFTITVQ